MTTAQQATEADRRSTSLFAAIRGVLVTPVAWFSNLSDEGAGRAVRIAILVQLVAGPIAEIESGLLGVGHPEPVRAALGGPLLTLMRIYLAATIVYVMGRFVTNKPRYGAIVRCLAYAQIPALALVVPFAGPVLAPVWCALTSVLALRHGLGRSWPFALGGTVAGPLLAVSLGLVLRTFVVEAFKVPQPGMFPTILAGDHIFARKGVYGWIDRRLPPRGDVIVFRFPMRPEQDFVQRVVGLPGDEISVSSGSRATRSSCGERSSTSTAGEFLAAPPVR